MRFTQALAVRNLIAKLHPPLSQTPRESQQLLSVLRDSFNKRLDDVHPSPQTLPTSRQHVNFGHFPDTGNLSANATNSHLRAVLSHPSLDQSSEPPSLPLAKIAELFDAALLQSSVNFAVIHSCVQMTKSFDSSSKRQASLQLGQRFASWFTSLNASSKRDFLVDRNIISEVIPLMYLADLEGTVWDWLRTLYEGSARPPRSIDLRDEDRFIALMTRENVKRRDLSAAIIEYCEASDYRLNRAPIEAALELRNRRPLLLTGNLISSAVLLQRHRHNIPASLYDRLLNHAPPENMLDRTLFWPFLAIYHPTAPDCELLCRALQEKDYISSLLLRIRSMNQERASKVLISVLDAAELMLNQGSRSKAQFLLDFTQQHLSVVPAKENSLNVRECIQQARHYALVQKYDHNLATSS